MKRIVTGDETWVYEFHMQTSQQASEWRHPTQPKPKNHASFISQIHIDCFFDYRGDMYSEFLAEGQTVNREYYLSVMRRLRQQF
jgi:[histone H3]-lysine36 N-dimethyltransferase SETMAR